MIHKARHNIIVVGEVDHGKSTLIGRLLLDTNSLPESVMSNLQTVCQQAGIETELAYLIDHLKEERDNNMTIDTAHSFLNTPKADITLIDSPGHAQLIKNMLTGAVLAEAAIIIIDINQPVPPQTNRLIHLLSMLGFSKIIIALNKIDLTQYSQELFDKQSVSIKNALSSAALKALRIIPISAKQGVNICSISPLTPWYSGKTLLNTMTALRSVKPSPEKTPFRLPVQDVYTISNKQLIVGEVSSGKLKSGQAVCILPQGLTYKIKSIRKFPRSVNIAHQADNIAVELSKKDQISRGNVLCPPSQMPCIAKRCTGYLFWFGENPLIEGTKIEIICATQRITGSVSYIGNVNDPASPGPIHTKIRSLARNTFGEVTFFLDQELIFESSRKIPVLNRFIIEQDKTTVAAGLFNRKPLPASPRKYI